MTSQNRERAELQFPDMSQKGKNRRRSTEMAHRIADEPDWTVADLCKYFQRELDEAVAEAEREMQAELQRLQKIEAAAQRLATKMGELSTAKLTEGIPAPLANDIGILHLELYAALSQDKEGVTKP